MVFKARVPIGRHFSELPDSPENDNLITTRILWLRGLEAGVNSGRNAAGEVVDTYDRYVYIHGTNHEERLGRPYSAGCVEMNNLEIIALFEIVRVDLATNVQIRTFPKGTSVEAVSVTALRRARSMMQPGEAEHVTPVFYRRPQDFRIVNLTSGGDFANMQMSVDTEADFALAERMISALRGCAGRLGLADLIALR